MPWLCLVVVIIIIIIIIIIKKYEKPVGEGIFLLFLFIVFKTDFQGKVRLV